MEDVMNQLGLALIAVLVPLVVSGVRWALPQIPKVFLPVLAAALGPVFDLAIHLIAGLELQGPVAIVAGLAAVGLREIKDQTVKEVRKRTAGGLSCAPLAVTGALVLLLLTGCTLTDSAQGKLDVAKATYASAVKAMTEAHIAGAIDDRAVVEILEPARQAARASIDAAEAAIGRPDFAGKAEAAFTLAVRLEAIYQETRHERRRGIREIRPHPDAGGGVRRAGLCDPCTGDPRGSGAFGWRAGAA